jgi:hypothetical protein
MSVNLGSVLSCPFKFLMLQLTGKPKALNSVGISHRLVIDGVLRTQVPKGKSVTYQTWSRSHQSCVCRDTYNYSRPILRSAHLDEVSRWSPLCELEIVEKRFHDLAPALCDEKDNQVWAWAPDMEI